MTLDRVRQIDVEADLNVWLDYARAKQLHGAVISYLTVKEDRFYMVQRKEDALSFVTARGWEDLSEILNGYEALNFPITEALVAQYIRNEATTRDFAAYYRLYQKYGVDYGIAEILNGTMSAGEYQEKVSMAQNGSFDERITVVNLMLEYLQKELRRYHWEDAVVTRLHDALRQFKGLDQSLTEYMGTRQKSLEIKIQNALIGPEASRQEKWVWDRLDELALSCREQHCVDKGAEYDHMKLLFQKDASRRAERIETVQQELQNAFRFAEDCFGDGQEMILLVSSLTKYPDALQFLRWHGCNLYLKYAQALMYTQREAALQKAARTLL